MNTEDFVTYEQALALKKLGFIEYCLYSYHKGVFDTIGNSYRSEDEVYVEDLYISYNLLSKDKQYEDYVDAPTLAQVQKWLRVKHKQSIEPKYDTYQWWCCMTNMSTSDWYDLDKSYSSYEEALSAGITECLKLLEKNED